MCTNYANHSPFALSYDGFCLASSSWTRCSGQATEVQIRPSIIVAPRRKELLPVHFFSYEHVLLCLKSGSFVDFHTSRVWECRSVGLSFRNRLLCRIFFSGGCIDKATFFYCNTSLLNGKCGAVNCFQSEFLTFRILQVLQVTQIRLLLQYFLRKCNFCKEFVSM